MIYLLSYASFGKCWFHVVLTRGQQTSTQGQQTSTQGQQTSTHGQQSSAQGQQTSTQLQQQELVWCNSCRGAVSDEVFSSNSVEAAGQKLQLWKELKWSWCHYKPLHFHFLFFFFFINWHVEETMLTGEMSVNFVLIKDLFLQDCRTKWK